MLNRIYSQSKIFCKNSNKIKEGFYNYKNTYTNNKDPNFPNGEKIIIILLVSLYICHS
jgi:hypothetical protein